MLHLSLDKKEYNISKHQLWKFQQSDMPIILYRPFFKIKAVKISVKHTKNAGELLDIPKHIG